MMRSLFSGVSGLKNHQTRMDVIGNNISNVNTTGFKSSRVNFTDILSQNLSGASSPNGNMGGTNPKQIGLGSAVGAVDMLFTNGSVQSTGVNTDLALSSSNALFIVETPSGTAYTRNGDFQFDAEGNYVQAGSGYFVRGWMADATGTLPASTTKGNLQNITIPAGKTMEPKATTLATYTNNLNSEIPLIENISGGVIASGTADAAPDNRVTVTTDGTNVRKAYGTNPYVNTTGTFTKDTTYPILLVDGDTFTLGGENATDTATVALADGSGAAYQATMTYDSQTNSTTFTWSEDGGVTTKTETYPGNGPYTLGTTTVPLGGNNYTIQANAVTKTTYTATDSVTLAQGEVGYFELNGNAVEVTYDGADIVIKDSSGTEVDRITGTDTFDFTTTTTDSGDILALGNGYKLAPTAVGSLTATITEVAKESNDSTDRVQATASHPITLTLNDGTKQSVTSGTYAVGESTPVITTLSVYGAEGSAHEIAIYFTRIDAKENTWRVSLDNDGGTETMLPDAAKDEDKTKVKLNNGQPVTLKFTDHGAYEKLDGGMFEMTLENGEHSPQNIMLDMSQLTQYASSSTIAGNADGNASGTLSSIAIDKTGTITGTYTNGEKRTEAQVAVAQFNNAGGLTKLGESLYQESNNSGEANVNTAAAFGATITPSALEMSNVDVANEFTDMIITQRGFQGNSKIITVSDEMLETLINMKR